MTTTRKLTVMRIMRERAGLSQAALGKQIGVSQGKISSWESGSVPIPSRRAYQIAQIIGVNPGDLQRVPEFVGFE